jgi:HSP20 family molecular chaperone IbpA
MTVPDGVTVDGIDADFENGVLTVQVALPEDKEVEPKRIPVGAKTS